MMMSRKKNEYIRAGRDQAAAIIEVESDLEIDLDADLEVDLDADLDSDDAAADREDTGVDAVLGADAQMLRDGALTEEEESFLIDLGASGKKNMLAHDLQEKKQKKKKRKWFWKSFLLLVLLLVSGFLYVGLRRVNILVVGAEHTRADTIMLVSVRPLLRTVDVVSIPRDTYHYTEGYDGLGQRKINASYGFTAENRIQNVVNSVQELLGVKVHFYVEIQYEDVERFVDYLGGVPVNLKYPMYYDDPYSDPPLHIAFEAGEHLITGADAMAFLRFRKSNDGTISIGDIGRIERQRDFAVAVLRKMMEKGLVSTGLEAIKIPNTNISIPYAVAMAIPLSGIDESNVLFHVLPGYVDFGEDGLSYYFIDEEELSKFVEKVLK